MAISGAGYPLPRSADEFERLCLRLLRRHWQLAQIERMHDPERRARGIHLLEISGRPRLAAVRCELREDQNALSANEIKDAAERVLSLGLPIGRFVIATTAARSASLQRILYDLNRAQKGAGPSAIEVITWDDIEELLDEYPQILTEFGSAAKRQAITRADSLMRLEAHPIVLEPNGAPPDAFEAEITAAAEFISQRSSQMARLALLRLREQCWGELNAGQKFRVLTNLGVAWLCEGEARRAAMLFIAARSLAPEDEQACTNEALAHELLGERDRAHALADRLRMQFPSSGRALALWLNNAPLAMDAGALEANVAPELGADPEVAMVMARRALSSADYMRAERYARAATQTLAGHSDPWLILGQSILLAELSGSGPAPVAAEGANPAAPPTEESRVREAESCFSQAIEFARHEGSAQNEVQGLIGRAQTRIALHDADGAGKDIEQAHALKREDANGLVEYGIVLRGRGNLNEAIEVFRRAVAVGGRDDAEYDLAITLRERDEPGDLHLAAEMLARAVARPDSVPKGDFPFAVSAAADVLGRLERWHEADAMLAGLPEGAVAPLALLILRANLRLAQGKFDQAAKFADDALAAHQADTPAEDRRKLAALLHDLGRYRDALPLWQILAASDQTADRRRLVECASRLGREDIIATATRGAAQTNAADASDSSEADLARLEQSDPEAAIEVIQRFLAQHPEDSVMRLRRSIAAERLGRTDLVIADPAAMPPARSVATALGREAVRIMREGGRASESLSYAYELLRRHPAELDAHRAYLAALGPIGPMPHVGDFDSAAPGAAVCFVEQDTNAEKWLVLEDANDPDEALDEFAPNSPMAKALKGKRVGDKFQLPEGRFSRKSGVVKQIVSKYAWRFQDCTMGWNKRFPGQPEIEMAPIRAEVVDWAALPATLEELLPAAARREDLLGSLEHAYQNNPIPIHAIAERMGVNDLQTMFVLAQRPGTSIKCCMGAPAELEEALGFLDRANAIVIDLTAIATLCMLGRLHLLATWPRQFVVSQATLAELRRLQFEDTLLRLPPGFSTSINGNGHDSKLRTDVQLKALADGIQSVCRVRDGGALAAIDGERRERLIKLLGRHGAESVVIAAMPGHVLWTDDRIMAAFAKSEFGVRRVWTSSALQARVRSGCLDAAELATTDTKLSGWGYSFTTPTIDMILRAGAVAMWNPDQFPLRQALDQFASPAISLADAMRLAAELIVRVYNDPNLRGSRRTFTTRLIDRIASRPRGRDSIEALPRSLPIRFGLDLIRARELSDVIRGWMASSARDDSVQSKAGGAAEISVSA
jgi:tetratricopeptide (TPR) repeat protein